MSLELTREELTDALEGTVAEILWETGVIEPPVDAFAIADRLGVKVATDARAVERARHVRMAAGAESLAASAVLLSPEERPERRQWAVAHEIGEWAAHRVVARLELDPFEITGTMRERCASALAGALLLPRRWFLPDGEAFDWDLPTLKSHYRTASHELIARRMLEMPSPAVITLFDHGYPVWRRGSEGLRVPPLLLAEEACQRQAFLRGKTAEADSDCDGAGRIRVRCWPVHEPGWRREIMRTELLDDGL